MKKRILIIEDDFISFVVGKNLFEGIGYEVEYAPSGEEGLDLFADAIIKQNPYDIVYMDIGLPNMSGIEVCMKIREYETEVESSHIPIVAVTAHDNQQIIDECLAAGIMEVLFKPLTQKKISTFQAKLI